MHSSGPRAPVRGADSALRQERGGGLGCVVHPVRAAAMKKVRVADRGDQRKTRMYWRCVGVVGPQGAALPQGRPAHFIDAAKSAGCFGPGAAPTMGLEGRSAVAEERNWAPRVSRGPPPLYDFAESRRGNRRTVS